MRGKEQKKEKRRKRAGEKERKEGKRGVNKQMWHLVSSTSCLGNLKNCANTKKSGVLATF